MEQQVGYHRYNGCSDRNECDRGHDCNDLYLDLMCPRHPDRHSSEEPGGNGSPNTAATVNTHNIQRVIGLEHVLELDSKEANQTAADAHN